VTGFLVLSLQLHNSDIQIGVIVNISNKVIPNDQISLLDLYCQISG